jgi:hypothetical protein
MVFEVYVRSDLGAQDWVCFDRPEVEILAQDRDLPEGLPERMLRILENVRISSGLSYAAPGFETMADESAVLHDDSQENEGIRMT